MLAVILGKRDTMKADSESMVVLEGEPKLVFLLLQSEWGKEGLGCDIWLGMVWFGSFGFTCHSG